jgi:phospho-N-acetylmuramoyl-pentapeptide-transferase
MIINVFKIFIPSVVAFLIGIAITPFLTDYLYRNKMWKKKAGKIDPNGNTTPIFNELHKDKEVGTPRMGGIIIWASTLITILIFWLLSNILSYDNLDKLNFLSRNQTWLPLFTLITAALVGLVDDLLQIKEKADGYVGGLPFRRRLFIVTLIGFIGALWFYFKLEHTSITVPFYGLIDLGWVIIPFFVFVMIALFSSSVIDGIDGLAGGIMAIIFIAYSGIAFFQHQIDLATFCAVIAGSTLAFLWFNIPPARFYMSETGILALTTTLTVIAFLTDSVLTLPIIALPLVVTALSVVIQLLSKKFRGKKVFLVAPLHHHFEALGWPPYKVVMRYWVITAITAIFGMVLTLISK